MRVKLKDITKFSKGTQINGKNLIDDGAYSYLNGGINPSGKWNEFNVAENTVTISEGGNSSGYVNYMSKAFWCGAHCYYLYDGPKNSKYLYYALKSQQERLFRIRSGACMPNIKKSDLGNFIIEYEEDETRQEEVVKVLEKCELLIEDYNKKLALLDEAVRARFVEMFGDENNSKGWEIVNIEDVVNVQVGVVIKPSQYYTNQYNGIKAFRSLNIGNGYIKDDDWVYFSKEGNKKNKKSILSTNDVLVVRSGAPGTACVVTSEYAGSNAIDVIIAHPDFQKVDSHYLCTYTNMPHGKSQIIEGTGGAAQQHFNVGKYNKLKLMLPPLEYQKQYVKFLEEIDKSRSRIQKSLEASQELFDSLMQEYFG
ncbi:restriction endonuclease subunit S [Catenibacterium mitsuokai]|uniref:restriction endonuclease subunit S n=1 Tax=Catenibacterium mitsuokai TaxID=100886 RepID=UPI0022E1B897|nr:restriction endonuclease subunit S [Catenibacterium mitsuokai]